MNKNITLKQLKIFLKIVYSGSLSEAAQQLDLTPSTVCKHLQQLENALGVTLIKRTTRTTIMTDAGSDLFNKIDSILWKLDDALELISSFHQQPQGEIKVTSSLALGSTQLMQAFSLYRQKYPDVNLYVDLSDKLINLNEENYDIALRITDTPPENYATKKLTSIYWVYCASPTYLKENGSPKTIQELAQHACLIYPSINNGWSYFDDKDKCQKHLSLTNVPLRANSSLALIEAALHGQGIAYVPTYLVDQYLEQGSLFPLLLEDYHLQQTSLYALYFPSRYRHPKIRSFIEFMTRYCQPTAPWDDYFLSKIQDSNISVDIF